MKCKVCGGSVRKGSGRMASVLVEGELVRGRVCSGCAGQGVLVVAAQIAACACGGTATTCAACVQQRVDKGKRGTADAKTLAVSLERRARAYASTEGEYSAGIKAGLEQAAGFLRQGTWTLEPSATTGGV